MDKQDWATAIAINVVTEWRQSGSERNYDLGHLIAEALRNERVHFIRSVQKQPPLIVGDD